ncbi:hypothetical protein ASD04_16070 [Devosia sp. Root436]|uniref:histidine phosphatase family protein n=1 Tax=Devosia sp. Root436 TaxID=1736537 RepID=UPI0006F7705F|nr:histidine phosphatase family protein [Devosia sp. Root436]KQX34897.1 hypothetical protein ASD04_16070 [Devosia sp. Root436]
MTPLDWPDFYFARHGETDWNRERRYQGTKDIPLNDTGRMQADASGVLLRELLERDNVDPLSLRWFASPLGRAAETMERMRDAFDMELPPVVLDPRLLEISFGTHEGRLHSESRANRHWRVSMTAGITGPSRARATMTWRCACSISPAN